MDIISDEMNEVVENNPLATLADAFFIEKIKEWASRVKYLETDLQYAWTCPHGNDYRDHACLECWGDGTEVLESCDKCKAGTWHRGGICLRHDLENAPHPYEALIKVAQEAERIETEAHLAADMYAYDLMRTVLRSLRSDDD